MDEQVPINHYDDLDTQRINHKLLHDHKQDDKEKKRLEQLERKKELAKLHDEEQESIKSTKAKTPSAKLTRHQIETHRRTVEAAAGLSINIIYILALHWQKQQHNIA